MLPPLPPPTHDSPRAKAERLAHPSVGWCGRCGRPWGRAVEPHVTNYTEHSGMFPLCEGCWLLLGHPEARIPYYAALVDHWVANGTEFSPVDRRGLTNAVAGGA